MTPGPVSAVRVGHVLTELAAMADESVHCVVTSPPYWGLRDYGIEPQTWPDGWVGSLGSEPTPDLYVAHMVAVFREVRRVLRKDGTLWLNLGDSYNGVGRGEKANGLQVAARATTQRTVRGLKPKDLVGIPWRVAFALQADGWYLRSDIIWAKPNPMPESIRDRPTKAHEYVFLLSRSARYFYDAEAIKELCESGPSDVRKMLESLPRIGGKHKDLIDPLSKASSTTNIGRKRSVGGSRKQDQTAAAQPGNSHHVDGFNERWDASEGNGTAPLLRNARSVWTVATQPYSGAHFATFPEELARRCIAAGCPKDGTVLDPFGGAGTTGLVAQGLGRSWVLIEIKPEYAEMGRARIHGEAPLFQHERGE